MLSILLAQTITPQKIAQETLIDLAYFAKKSMNTVICCAQISNHWRKVIADFGGDCKAKLALPLQEQQQSLILQMKDYY